MNKKLTIKDIAQLAGVSKGTVDRVLHKRGKVSQKALDSINAVLNQIDYEPNLIARNLKNNKIYTICVVLPNPASDSYWLPCIKGIEEAIKEFKAFNLSIQTYHFDSENTESFIAINETVLNLSPDAVLLAPLFYKEALDVVDKYNNQNILVNTFNNEVKSNEIRNFVGQDLYRSGRIAAKLMESITLKGQIAIIHFDEKFKNAIYIQEKEKGFRNYFIQKENTDYEITTLKLKKTNYKIKFANFLEENPNLTGVFITTSKAYKIAEIINKTEHNRISIIGYDLLDKNISFLNQGTIDFLINQNPKQQVYLGISSLVDHFIFGKQIKNATLLSIDIVNSENASYYME